MRAKGKSLNRNEFDGNKLLGLVKAGREQERKKEKRIGK